VFGGPAWTWDARRGQYYLHNFLAEQPDLNVHDPAVQNALLDIARFWLDRQVDGFRVDAINFAMHDPELRNNPPARPGGKRTRPFDFQQHLYNQSHPGIVGFLERLRHVVDSYEGRFTLAEVGGETAVAEMHAYTQGESRLHSAYGFDFLYAERLSPGLVAQVAQNWPDGSGSSWPTWAFENHDAPRALSRWAPPGQLHEFARTKMLLLSAMRGSIILFQGEELGLPQVHVPFEQLQDPEAIANWPQTLNRDGARTPMPWRSNAPHLGFSNAEPWLPAGEEHRPLAVDRQEAEGGSMLSFTRQCLRLRSSMPALRLGSMRVIEAGNQLLRFKREHDGQRLLCTFNLSNQPARFAASGSALVTVGDLSAEEIGAFSASIEDVS
jgi:alpha-glucosidase